MCLYPRFIKNKRYLAYNTSHKKWEKIAECEDYRKMYVPIGCGECYECRRQKAQQWRVRLQEELKVNKHAYFVTLTFSNESLLKLMKETETTTETNAIATLAVRRFLERYRKKNKHSLKHWLITELGHENTERIHLHGIIFTKDELTNEELAKYWKYGRTDTGQYCNEQSINYIVKYVTKIDVDHKTYKAVILCSSGLGENFVHTIGAKQTYKYKPRASAEYYTLNNGNKVALPIYYRNKLYTQKERDKMWTDRLDKAEIYVNGIRIRNINTNKGQQEYYKVLQCQQEWNKKIGYGDTSKEWQKEIYNIDFKMLQSAKKCKKK